MQPNRFDTITRLFAERRLSRRKALTETGASIAAAGLAATGITTGVARVSAQEATPAIEQPPSPTPPTYLFVQGYQSGTVTQKDADRYSLTLENGLGDTVYFTDRPDRLVGTLPTGAFLEWLDFPDDNPPNAAILTDNGGGESTTVVVELFNPTYDVDTATATYDFEILKHWQNSTDLTFAETPIDVPDLGASFGSAHLFIDGIADCPDATMQCIDRNSGEVVGEIPNADHDGYCYSYFNVACLPCAPAWDYQGNENSAYWRGQCAERFEGCAGGNCHLTNFCSRDAPLGNTLCR